jgi:hypothetical protein
MQAIAPVSPARDTALNQGLYRIVVVGGGAGGLELATRLGDYANRGGNASVVLVDRCATHLWKPLLHEVAAGSMDANAHQLDYIAQARWHHFEFQQGDLMDLDRAGKVIRISAVRDLDGTEILPMREIPYDSLVVRHSGPQLILPSSAVGRPALSFLRNCAVPRRRLGPTDYIICIRHETSALPSSKLVRASCRRCQNGLQAKQPGY